MRPTFQRNMLPTSIELWKSKALDEDGFGWQWEILRPFFLRKGYDLYVSRGCHGLKAREDTDPAADSFNLHGVRENFSKKPLFASFNAEVWGARDRENRDVVIKPVSYGDRPSNELQILRYLNSDTVRTEQTTATVPIIEFVEHAGWTFAVMPRWSDSTYPEFVNIGEVLDWAVQLINAVAFIHRHNIAHLDISHENVLMNFWGVVPRSRNFGTLAPELRSGFPVKYALIDFGHSVHFAADSDTQSRRGIWPVPREQSAPETKRGRPFNPFAADVYQTGRTIFGWCKEFIEDVPEVLAVLQDMTRRRPENRLTAAESLAQMRAAEKTVLPATKARELPVSLLGEYSPVPSRRRMYVYGHSPY
ncbi:kinase-like domain-containing protein [Sparassis latifolia]